MFKKLPENKYFGTMVSKESLHSQIKNIYPGPGQYINESEKRNTKMDENYILKLSRDRPINFQEQYRRLTEAKLHPDVGHYNPGLYKEFNTKLIKNATFKSKSNRKELVNHHELENPHNHLYNPEIDIIDNQPNKNWMFKKETIRRVPVNLYNPTVKVETNIEPGPAT